jgi:hypothetical protein
MKTSNTLVWFRKSFPIASSLLLTLAVLCWGIVGVRGIIEGTGKRPGKLESSLPSWSDFAPTCDVVLRELGKAHASVRDALVRCHGGESSLAEFSEHLKATKRGLRKLNIGGLEEPDVKECALVLRQSQISLYTVMRQRAAQFAESGASATAEAGPGAVGNLVEQWRHECNAFSAEMADFAYNVHVLQDEIADARAAAAIFGQIEDFDVGPDHEVPAVRRN